MSADKIEEPDPKGALAVTIRALADVHQLCAAALLQGGRLQALVHSPYWREQWRFFADLCRASAHLADIIAKPPAPEDETGDQDDEIENL